MRQYIGICLNQRWIVTKSVRYVLQLCFLYHPVYTQSGAYRPKIHAHIPAVSVCTPANTGSIFPTAYMAALVSNTVQKSVDQDALSTSNIAASLPVHFPSVSAACPCRLFAVFCNLLSSNGGKQNVYGSHTDTAHAAHNTDNGSTFLRTFHLFLVLCPAVNQDNSISCIE